MKTEEKRRLLKNSKVVGSIIIDSEEYQMLLDVLNEKINPRTGITEWENYEQKTGRRVPEMGFTISYIDFDKQRDDHISPELIGNRVALPLDVFHTYRLDRRIEHIQKYIDYRDELILCKLLGGSTDHIEHLYTDIGDIQDNEHYDDF